MKLMYLGVVSILGAAIPFAANAQAVNNNTASSSATTIAVPVPGQAANEAIWNAENRYWENNYTGRAYVKPGTSYSSLQPAYRYGVDAFAVNNGKRFEEVEPQLRSNWEASHPTMHWEQAREAARDSYTRLYDTRTAIQTGQTGRVLMNNPSSITPGSVGNTVAAPNTNSGVAAGFNSPGGSVNSNSNLSVGIPINPSSTTAGAGASVKTAPTGTISNPTPLSGTITPGR